MDRLFRSRGTLRPLDCIPVVLKDNFDTADMPMYGVFLTLADSVPLEEAFVEEAPGCGRAHPR